MFSENSVQFLDAPIFANNDKDQIWIEFMIHLSKEYKRKNYNKVYLWQIAFNKHK